LFECRADALVAVDRRTRGRGDLQQEHLLALFGMLDEKPFVAEEALLEALRVVEPVHADDHRPAVRAADHPLVSLPRGVALRQLAEFARVDPDRADEHPHAALADAEGVAVNLGPHLEYCEI